MIRGTGVNQDGKTNGITAPNPLSQSKLELEVYRKSKVNPAHITLVEAHGTGTKLGDPAEVDALTQAFGEFTRKKQFCAIGSVKTNIGHTSEAAGIASLIKVLLSLKYRQIPASLHCATENLHIDFKNSPFFVNKKLSEWVVPEGEKRIAAISSFGFSGTNVHVVIEEWPRPAKDQTDLSDQTDQSYLIVLSAKNENRLKEIARNLLTYLTINHQPSRKRDGRPAAVEGSNATVNIPSAINLRDLAYTLQVGRRTMEERLAFIVHSIKVLEERLTSFLKNKSEPANCFRGRIVESSKRSSWLLEGEAGKAYIQVVLKRKQLDKLAELWVSGIEIDWNLLYEGATPQRLSLPTYPFARERYWLDALSWGDAVSPCPEKNTVNQTVENLFFIPVWKRCGRSQRIALQDICPDGESLVVYHQKSRKWAEKLHNDFKKGNNTLVSLCLTKEGNGGGSRKDALTLSELGN